MGEHHAYTVGLKQIGIESPLWTWQIDLEAGNGVWDHGTADSRRAAVRQITRSMRRHSRKIRKEQPEDWWRKEALNAAVNRLKEKA